MKKRISSRDVFIPAYSFGENAALQRVVPQAYKLQRDLLLDTKPS